MVTTCFKVHFTEVNREVCSVQLDSSLDYELQWVGSGGQVFFFKFNLLSLLLAHGCLTNTRVHGKPEAVKPKGFFHT